MSLRNVRPVAGILQSQLSITWNSSLDLVSSNLLVPTILYFFARVDGGLRKMVTSAYAIHDKAFAIDQLRRLALEELRQSL